VHLIYLISFTVGAKCVNVTNRRCGSVSPLEAYTPRVRTLSGPNEALDPCTDGLGVWCVAAGSGLCVGGHSASQRSSFRIGDKRKIKICILTKFNHTCIAKMVPEGAGSGLARDFEIRSMTLLVEVGLGLG
jgi:hypothetical protein